MGIVAVVGAAAVAGLFVLSMGRASGAPPLPNGCVKPTNGFLLIAGDDSYYGVGYNNSKGHGAPTDVWPIITVKEGSEVTIIVCNTDVQAHSFNIIHYLGGTANTIAPHTVQTFRFVATQTGNFTIYCDIFCSIHIFMQNGQLRVVS